MVSEVLHILYVFCVRHLFHRSTTVVIVVSSKKPSDIYIFYCCLSSLNELLVITCADTMLFENNRLLLLLCLNRSWTLPYVTVSCFQCSYLRHRIPLCYHKQLFRLMSSAWVATFNSQYQQKSKSMQNSICQLKIPKKVENSMQNDHNNNLRVRGFAVISKSYVVLIVQLLNIQIDYV